MLEEKGVRNEEKESSSEYFYEGDRNWIANPAKNTDKLHANLPLSQVQIALKFTVFFPISAVHLPSQEPKNLVLKPSQPYKVKMALNFQTH